MNPFDMWLNEFIGLLVQSGMPQPQANKYRREYSGDAHKYYEKGVSPGDACMRELLP